MRSGLSRTDIGKVRQMNQDAVYAGDVPEGGLVRVFIVADGMGGHKAGEVASGRAVEMFREYLANNPEIKRGVEEYLREAVMHANAGVYALSVKHYEYRGMGTTFTVCALLPDGSLHYAHVGDSRLYTVGPKGIKQITDDHSFVAEMMRLGRLTEEEARVHTNKNILTRSLGTDRYLDVDTGHVPAAANERVLICSDGLSNMVTDAEIEEILNGDGGDCDKADALVAHALESGGVDNISLIIISTETEDNGTVTKE